MNEPAAVADEAIGLPIRPIGIHRGAEGDVDVRSAFVEALVLAHEALQLLAVDFGRDGLGLQDRHAWVGWGLGC